MQYDQAALKHPRTFDFYLIALFTAVGMFAVYGGVMMARVA